MSPATAEKLNRSVGTSDIMDYTSGSISLDVKERDGESSEFEKRAIATSDHDRAHNKDLHELHADEAKEPLHVDEKTVPNTCNTTNYAGHEGFDMTATMTEVNIDDEGEHDEEGRPILAYCRTSVQNARPYDDDSYFSREVSELSLLKAQRRAAALAEQLQSIEASSPVDRHGDNTQTRAGASPSVVGSVSAKAASILRRKGWLTNEKRKYSLLQGSPDAETSIEGFGPEAAQLEGESDEDRAMSSMEEGDFDKQYGLSQGHKFLKSALKRTDSNLESLQQGEAPRKKKLSWHPTTEELVKPNVVDGKKKPGMIRRLSMVEKNELYEVRPDLRITPNWAQKYKEEILGQQKTNLKTSYVALILVLLLFLACLVIFIVLRSRRHK